ncbi:glycerol phosphate lipoteichoic acid synthase [Cytobacillus firmus]|uniref:LTA synthase family protein n=1 Tax=Cytobacillus firmus TaxID=1399 RepID=UPI00077CD3C0|nr:LTA synthase family protein [Cytobacillus firmus]MBG9542414.1 glycerol phosphate lipoteichoic acid synthase [Cytobacillus firmus]MBG9552036.1 glycerol phosphate lipoteichoic acid synthase [Cytobacillus firmus]MBG9558333.1 glycerol phosphate lipoteichoic acid synthase [Cytobacillus firmus]MBG9573430.1 glycerol phosphate lipoteichoic acid synthase [Cytobacillus firmus]MEC1891863.1 LTA synthase family protein [Cytobacillus firmus]
MILNTLLHKSQDILNKYIGFFFLAVFLLWMKTYITQITQFNLGIESALQQFLLFINPLGSSLLFLGVAFFFKGRRKYIALMVMYFLLSFLLFANAVYYRFFNDFITLPTLTQTQNFGDVSGSISSLLQPTDIFFFLDFIVLAGLLIFKAVKIEIKDMTRRRSAALIYASLAISFANLGLAETDRPELLTRGFDRNYIVKYLGMYNYTIYDAVQSTKASAQRVMADSSDTTEVINFTKSNYAEPNPKYFGKAEGMNVIYLHLESIQTFLMNYELHGEEVTPFLNSLIEEENTTYFDNFFHQTAQGKTADAEFILENSLYGLPQGSAFTTKGMNTYNAAPAILKDKGYTSAVFHGNSGSFWNRNEIYKSFGYDNFFDADYYDLKPENMADYGLMDKPFFEQSMPYLKSLKQPFYSKFITVSHHYPYHMDQELATIEPHTTGDKSVDNYFQTARYADEALKQFFEQLKASGLYENSVIVMYGDHYGISKNHNKAMEQVLGKEISAFDNAGLQRVPLFIRVPGMGGGVNHEFGGQIDLMPTLMHLLGIDTKQYLQFGTDLLSENHDDLVPFRNGDFMSPSISSVDGKFYDSTTGELLEESRFEEAKKLQESAEQKLALSDKVVNGDLLRFYTPENFEPVDRSKYDYKAESNGVNKKNEVPEETAEADKPSNE